MANFDEVWADYTIEGLENSQAVSYALTIQNRAVMLIEIRPLYSDISNPSVFSKIFVTAKASPASYLAITNGVQWLIYDVEDSADKANNLFPIDIREKTAAERLSLFNKQALRDGSLKQYAVTIPEVERVVPDRSRSNYKSRGYKVSDETHKGISHLRQEIMTSRSVKDQEISNSLLVELVLETFLDSKTFMDTKEISNEVILKKRIEETLEKRFK